MTPNSRPPAVSVSRRLTALDRRPGHPDPAEAYLATELATTPPRQLTGMLHQGLIHTCRQAIDAFDAGQIDRALARLNRARRVLMHLQAGAEARRAPLYQRVLARLDEAEHFRKREPIAESIRSLERATARAVHADEGTATRPALSDSWIA